MDPRGYLEPGDRGYDTKDEEAMPEYLTAGCTACSKCGKAGDAAKLSECPTCHVVSYCNEVCREKHAPWHAPVCAEASALYARQAAERAARVQARKARGIVPQIPRGMSREEYARTAAKQFIKAVAHNDMWPSDGVCAFFGMRFPTQPGAVSLQYSCWSALYRHTFSLAARAGSTAAQMQAAEDAEVDALVSALTSGRMPQFFEARVRAQDIALRTPHYRDRYLAARLERGFAEIAWSWTPLDAVAGAHEDGGSSA
jgi:hypothetical protein